jgi:Spy/CpxP family protein refolding chaperone
MKRLVWRYTQLIMLVLCGFVSLLTPVLAQPPSPPRLHGPPHEARLEHLVEAIGLDEKTLTEVYKIIDASKAEHRELRRKLREAHDHMRSLLEQDKPDEATVMAQADVIGGLETEARKQRLQTMLQVHALLTPEQRTKLLELLRTRRPRGPCRLRPPEGRRPAEVPDSER